MSFNSLSIIGFVFLITSCNNSSTTSQNSTNTHCLDKKIIEQLDIKTLENSSISQTVTLSGEVSYDHDKIVSYTPLIAGVVEQIYFEIGDFVTKGQVLALVQSMDLNQINQELQNFKIQRNVALKEYQAAEQMYQDGLISQKELLQVKSELDILENSIATLSQNLSNYHAFNTKGAYQIKAPITGYIVEKNITKAMYIDSSQQSLFTIADLSKVWVMANVYTINMAHITPGESVLVNTMAYPKDYFKGVVNKISHVLDQQQRVLKAQIILDNTDLKLRPGMTADIILQVESDKESAVAIPNNAIIFDNNQNYVVEYIDECHQIIQPIEPVARNAEFTYTRTGVEPKTRVITNNALLIYQQINNPF